MEANLRFVGPETMESKIFARLTAWQNWIFQRPNAVGEDGRAAALRHRTQKGAISTCERCDDAAYKSGRRKPHSEEQSTMNLLERRLHTKIPNNVESRPRTGRC